MLCALTVRKLKPGSMEDFKACLHPLQRRWRRPPGWKRFYAIRNVAPMNEVITFGFFDGTLEELRAGQQDNGEVRQAPRRPSDAFVESVELTAIFEVVEERSME